MHEHEQAPRKPIRVEVIAYAPTAFYHCQHCEVAFQEVGVGQRIHREQVAHALPDDLAQDYQGVSDWVRALAEHYKGAVIVKVIDAASLEGFWKSLRYGVRRYPAVIVEGKDKHVGADLASTYRLIDQHLVPTSIH
jgi:hypothetical protein